MKSMNDLSPNNISKEILGLTDSHISYFKQPETNHTVGVHHSMLENFQALVACAKKEDIEIKIASGFRSFERQLLIWNNKFSGITVINDIDGKKVDVNTLDDGEIVKAILVYSALPGASRHHWGCDIDIYADNLLAGKPLRLEPWEYSQTGPMAKLTTWLAHNAVNYGFYFPYDKFRGGIAPEPWHLSYAPLARKFQPQLELAILQDYLSKIDIAGKAAITNNLSEIFSRYINNVCNAPQGFN